MQKILSAEKFCPLKILSDKVLFLFHVSNSPSSKGIITWQSIESSYYFHLTYYCWEIDVLWYFDKNFHQITFPSPKSTKSFKYLYLTSDSRRLINKTMSISEHSSFIVMMQTPTHFIWLLRVLVNYKNKGNYFFGWIMNLEWFLANLKTNWGTFYVRGKTIIKHQNKMFNSNQVEFFVFSSGNELQKSFALKWRGKEFEIDGATFWTF